MKQIIEEYGGAILAFVAVIALIVIVALLLKEDSTVHMAFKTMIENFFTRANAELPIAPTPTP